MGQLDEAGPGLRVEAVPVGPQIGRAIDVEQLPLAAVQAPDDAGQARLDRRAEPIIIRAGGQRRTIADLEVADHEGVQAIAVRHVEELVLILRHHPGAQANIVTEARRRIQLQADIVVAAIAGGGPHLGRVQRALAHHVDAAGRVTRAAEQARRAAQHFDPLEEEQVGHVARETEGERRHPVDQVVVDRKAARDERGILAADPGDGDAIGRGHHVFQREQVLLLEPRAIDHGHCVRHVLQRRQRLADLVAEALAEHHDV